MKTLSIIFSFILFSLSATSFAQTKTEKLKVSGECGTCKKKIEAAAKNAGATYALWNKDSKVLTIKYNSNSSNTEKIEQAIANTGYDTPDFKASDDAYNQLDDCCKYDRTSASETAKDAHKKGDKCADDKDCKKTEKVSSKKS
jgi:hypothetical protein